MRTVGTDFSAISEHPHRCIGAVEADSALPPSLLLHSVRQGTHTRAQVRQLILTRQI